MFDIEIRVAEIRRLLAEARYKSETLLLDLENLNSAKTFDAELDTVLLIEDIEIAISALQKLKIKL